MLTMIDMGISNLQSVVQAFARVGAEVLVTESREDVERADALVLPGVGAFPDAMARLNETRLVEPIRAHVLERGRPLVGICLGMQLLCDGSEEHGDVAGLRLVPGRARRLAPADPDLRVPNIGWCDVRVERAGALLPEASTSESFYFAHSYHVQCEDAGDVAATIEYGGRVVAAVERGPVCGLQFHPEKSQDAGLDVLAAFARAA